MNERPAEATSPREELRRRWLSHAAAAFDLMFHPDHQPDLVSFVKGHEPLRGYGTRTVTSLSGNPGTPGVASLTSLTFPVTVTPPP
jgi:hypothetical protein